MYIWKESDQFLQNEINKLQDEEWKISQEIKAGKKSDDGWTPAADGIINIKNYLTAAYKILWILKEPNYSRKPDAYSDFGEEEFENREQGRKDLVHSPVEGKWDIEGIWSTMTIDDMYKDKCNGGELAARRVMLVSYAILQSIIKKELFMPCNIEDNGDEKIKALQSIALINIKKAPGYVETKKNKNVEYEIVDAYKENKNLLKLQIETYKPHIVIGGSTLQYFVEDKYFEKKNSRPMNYTTNLYGPNWRDRNYYPLKDRIWINAYHPSFYKKKKSYGEVIEKEEKDYIEKIVNAVLDWRENYYRI